MSSRLPPTPTRTRSSLLFLLSFATVVVCLGGLLGCRAPVDAVSQGVPRVESSSTQPSPQRVRQVPNAPDVPRVSDAPRGASRDRLGVAGGRLPVGVTVFDDSYPAVAELDPALLRALRTASTDATGDGVTVQLNSGWRSPAYQEQLLERAISTYGSRAEAARWVATPATSPHVSGDAVDVRGTRATTWLAEHGSRYGLCRVFANEPWHFELRPEAVERGCPAPYADPTHDPRMRR
jgi:D-alanyl-D-alanine carboxypeptidase